MKFAKLATVVASAALVATNLFTPANAFTPPAEPVAPISDSGYTLQNIASGKGRVPTAVYRNPGDNHLVYVNSMQSFPAGHQFAYIQNGYGSNRYMTFQFSGTRTIRATCVTPGHTRMIGTDVVSAWISTSVVAGYGCTPGHVMHAYL